MFREITIGQYYPIDSIIHKLDPRVKLFMTLIYLISLFVVNGPIGYILAAIMLLISIRLSKVPLSYMTKGLKSIMFLLLISVGFNLFLTPGEIIWHMGFLKISRDGLRISIMMAVRLIMLVLGSSLMTLTTTPNQLTDGLEKGLSWLKLIHVPVHEIAMMMSIALRFIPILVQETDKIMKAQQARGADFESGNILRRAKAMVPILVPLFISAFRRANDLAMAMEARCYHGGEGRTRMKELKYKSCDRKAYIIIALYFLLALLSRFISIEEFICIG